MLTLRLLGNCLIGDGCWEWQRAVNRKGYGKVKVAGRHRTAHRMSYQHFVGEIPPGMWVLHRCDNPACIRPSHLFLGTHKDNEEDKDRKGRRPRGEKHRNSKLTERLVQYIREQVKQGRSHNDVATEVGVCKSTVGYVSRRVIWNHI